MRSELKVGREAIAKWEKRYLTLGLEGLKDAPRPGRKAIYTEADKARVIQKAGSKPEEGYANWSQRRTAKDLGMSQSTVHSILKSHDLKPHKVDDEKTQIQALDRSQPELPLQTGKPKRLTAIYKRHGTVSLIAALS
ncbi:MAG: helix-turn-helix domain-containing protein, partial [Bacteroidota bacterium]